MTLSNQFVDRGKHGNTPAMTTRADETFLDFVSDMRNVLMHAPNDYVEEVGTKAVETAGARNEQWPECVASVREALMEDGEVSTWLRVKRSLQEAYWDRIITSYGEREGELMQRLEAADKKGPGTLKWDPNFKVPEYATVDIHIQPGGFVHHPLAGFHYDYGTRVFFGGINAGDAQHMKMARKTATPKDGKVKRFLDLGTSIGQLPCQVKRLYPDAEVWGIDIGAPMVRYAHLRAVEQDLDVNFAQMASENLEFPDNHFDVVSAHLLFHEIPMPIIKATIAEAFRVLRPGGVFVIWDFPSATSGNRRFSGFMRTLDAADNGEPYSVEFVNADVERLMTEAGFKLRYTSPEDIMRHGRVGDKP
ncbi:MAG: class I SAM-dependent methyltransferase [Rhodobacteraceae bacterium]|nr:class I SAM-dependent methyltransferase [Paracoccaceae bacterium]